MRFVVRGDAELHKMECNRLEDYPIQVQLRDLGRGGVGFVSPIALEVNSTWRSEFHQRGYMIGQVCIIVRHCRAVRDGVFLIGSQICLESGMMYLLGINPEAVREGDSPAAMLDGGNFLAPTDIT
jgi:hypothetical protein